MPEGDETTNLTIDVNSTQFKEALATAVGTETAALKANREEILAEKRKLKEQYDALQGQVSELGDLNVLKNVVKQFQEDSEAKLIAEGKIDEVLAQRTDSMRRDAEAKIEAATAKLTETQTALEAANGRIAELQIGHEVDDAARELDCQKTAFNDIRRAALDVFGINSESLSTEARDKSGTLLFGPDGKSPLTPRVWLEQQKKISPHWWGPSAGGGAPGGRRGESPVDANKLDKMSGPQLLRLGVTNR